MFSNISPQIFRQFDPAAQCVPNLRDCSGLCHGCSSHEMAPEAKLLTQLSTELAMDVSTFDVATLPQMGFTVANIDTLFGGLNPSENTRQSCFLPNTNGKIEHVPKHQALHYGHYAKIKQIDVVFYSR